MQPALPVIGFLSRSSLAQWRDWVTASYVMLATLFR
jgi:hypothetical protein